MPVSSTSTTLVPDSPPDSGTQFPSTATTAIPVSTDKEDPLSQPAPHLATFKWFDNVIFELNGVFLQSPDSSKVDKRTQGIRYDVTTSLAWTNFERGLIGLDECRAQISAHFQFSEAEVADVVDSAMSWQSSAEIPALASELQSMHCLYAIGNLPQPVFDELKESIGALDLFKEIFVSSKLNERLPHPAILTKALASAMIDPKRTLYIGHHIDNVITARSFGFQTIKCIDPSTCIQHIRKLCREPIAPAKRWLKSRAGALDLETSLGITIKDAYMQSCILDATGDKSLIYYDPSQRLFSWYHDGSAPNGLPQFPPDVDCNSLAYSAFSHLDSLSRERIMDQMLLHVDSQGILQGYLSFEKIRLDVLMCVNGLALFHEYGRGHELAATETWLYSVLATRAFRDGTHYYPSPDLFLYFVSRLLRKAPTLRSRFAPVLRECVLERTEADGDALALAARLIAAARCGVVVGSGHLLERLLVMQKEDGSWEAGVVYRFNRTEGVAWHQGFTVALAVLAIEEWDFLRRG